MMFAVITPALFVGAVVGRIRFKFLLWFLIAWSLCVYYPEKDPVLLSLSGKLTAENFYKIKAILARKDHEIQAITARENHEIRAIIAYREQKIREALAYEESNTKTVKFNRAADLEKVLKDRNQEIAAILCES